MFCERPIQPRPRGKDCAGIIRRGLGHGRQRFGAAVVIQPTPAEIDAAARIGAPAYPHTVYPPQKIAAGMAAIDTSGCPADFKDAWRALALALAQPETKPTSDMASDSAANADPSEIFQQKKLQSYLINLKLISSSYGVAFQ